MLHVQSEIKANNSWCVVEYDNPINNIRKEYRLRLHSVYSKANDFGNVDIPITYKVQDTRYIKYFEYSLSNSKTIKKVSQEIKNKLNSQNFTKQLKKFANQPLVAEFNNQPDEDESTRYFDIKLPRNTYLFSNNKYILYALGYSDNQLGVVDDLSRIGFSRHHIEPSLSAVATDISKIYVVQNNNQNSFFPSDTEVGNFKWQTDDKFENVYLISKRNQRNRAPVQLIRTRRQAGNFDFSDDVVLLPTEKENIIESNDLPIVKKNKLLQNRKWEEIAERILINFDDNLELDLQDLKLQVLYWRDKLVDTIINTNNILINSLVNVSKPVTLTLPSAFLNIDEKLNFYHPFTYLLQDDASYVQIAASKILLDFFKKYKEIYDEKIQAISPSDFRKSIYNKQLLIADEKIAAITDIWSEKLRVYKKLYEESLIEFDLAISDDGSSSNNSQNGKLPEVDNPSLSPPHSSTGGEDDAGIPPTKKSKTEGTEETTSAEGLSESITEEVNSLRELEDRSPLPTADILAGQNLLKGESAAANSDAMIAAIKTEEAAAQIKVLEEEILDEKDQLLLKKSEGDALFDEVKAKFDEIKENVTEAQSAALSTETYNTFLVKALAAKTATDIVVKNAGILRQFSNTYELQSTKCDEKIERIRSILNGAKRGVKTAATGVFNAQQKANAALDSMTKSLQNARRGCIQTINNYPYCCCIYSKMGMHGVEITHYCGICSNVI